MTKVVNVKVCYLRPKYNNLEEWCNDKNNIYIGRAGIVFINGVRYPKNASIFSNPYKINKDGDINEILIKYENYIEEKIKCGEIKIESLLKLKGKSLGCWCVKPNQINVMEIY